MNYTEQIRSYARQLKLSNLASRPFDFLAEPVPNEVFLVECLKEEINYREEKAKQRRIAQACLPTFKSFDAFDLEFQKASRNGSLISCLR